MEVLVSAEDDAEVRRVSITNSGSRPRDIEVTSYAELVLAPQSADLAHPAFSKLFVHNGISPDVGAILATRRKRSPSDPEIWAAHLTVVDGEAWARRNSRRQGAISRSQPYRSRADRDPGQPTALEPTGAVLDPIFSIRRRIRIAPGATVRVAYWTIAAASREALLDGVDKHRDATAFTRASTLAWTQGQVQLHHLGVTAGEASLFQRLAGHVIYAAPAMRPSSETILRGAARNRICGRMGISGDLPIVLLRIADIENLDVVPRAPAGARILADEAARRRSRHPERSPLLLCPGTSNRDRDPGADEQVVAAAGYGGPAGPRLRAASRSDGSRDEEPSYLGRAGRSCRRSAADCPTSSIVSWSP